MSSCSQLRQKARLSLSNNIFSKEWLMLLVALLISEAILGAVSFTAVITLILFGPLQVGVSVFVLKTIRNQADKNNLVDLFSAFGTDFSGSLILGLLQSIFIMLWSLLFVIPGIVKACSYAMCFYIKADHPELSATECLDKSRAMMNGHKWHYFCLQLSFIGWMIVGSLCLGVGVLWVSAYICAANTHFYEELNNTPAEA